jgi:hypothetical protein
MTKRRIRIYHDERRFERVDDEDLYEVVGEEEEVVEDEEEVVVEDEEVVDDDAEVAGRPRGDPVLEYAYGLSRELPAALGEWQFSWLLSEYSKAVKRGDQQLARRWARLIFQFCPSKPRACPLYTLTVSRCPFNLQQRCRGFAQAEKRRAEKPKKWRSWYRGG